VGALLDFSSTVSPGEIYGLLGPNGSGKTTLLRLLMGFLRPTGGSAKIANLDCYSQSVAVHAQVAYLPGEVRLFRMMRGRQVLRFFSQIHPAGNYQRSLDLAERFQLDLSRQVAFCSTGMRQKLALAAALAMDTPLLILDEPTSNLDPTARGDVLALLREAKQNGRAILFSSHVLSETEQICDRVAILKSGELVHTQVIGDLRRQHRIRGRLIGPMKPVPEQLSNTVSLTSGTNGDLAIQTEGELSPLLGWLAELPLAEVRIDPIGLQAVYNHFHPSEA
jgi:ABC-2 type transport system ATP-binding protein